MVCKGERTTDLLEHLIYIGQNCSVQVPVLVHDEAILESALRHLKDGIFDRVELALN
jgi:hypothetical protein